MIALLLPPCWPSYVDVLLFSWLFSVHFITGRLSWLALNSISRQVNQPGLYSQVYKEGWKKTRRKLLCRKRQRRGHIMQLLPCVSKPQMLVFISIFECEGKRAADLCFAVWSGLSVHRFAYLCSLVGAFSVCIKCKLAQIHPLKCVCESLLWVCILTHLYICMEGSNWVVEDRAQHRRELAGVIEGWAVCLWELATLPLSPRK